VFENKLSNFMHRFGKAYTRDEWLEAHSLPDPKPRRTKAQNTITRSIMRPWQNNELAERVGQLRRRSVETVGQLSMCKPAPTEDN
jgi:hypothetical protein